MANETGRWTGLCRTQTHGDFENLLWIERKHEICVALNPLRELTETELNWIQLGAIWRQKPQTRAALVDRSLDFGIHVDLCVVEYCD
jgi:hypothetical protein